MTDNLPSTVHSVGFSFNELQRIAESMARSQLFGIRTTDQALSLMLISQAEGRHPALAAMDYDIINGKPVKKAEAMMRHFMEAGGKIVWHLLTDTEAQATFSHPMGGTQKISWDMKQAAQAGLSNKDNWKKYPRQMLRSRVVSEGVRTIYPTATSGMYVPEEAQDFASHEPIDVTPPTSAGAIGAEWSVPKPEAVKANVDQWRAERDGATPRNAAINFNEVQFDDVGTDLDRLLAQGNAVCGDVDLLQRWWTKHLSSEQRGILGAKGRGVGPYLPGWKLGEKQTKQASPQAPLAAEQPADEGSPEPAPPQAEIPKEDAFGLPPLPDAKTDDDVACEGILQLVTACTTQDDIFEIEKAYEARMNRLPEAKWRDLVAAIGKHKSALFEAQK
jgi:hypothetical protein